MTQEKKYSRNRKYNYLKAMICEQSDRIFRQCYTCHEWKPLDNDNYLRNDREVMWFTFQCKDCRNEYKRQRKQYLKDHPAERHITNVEQKELFDWKVFTKEESEEETVESKVDRILAFLWLNKWAFKKS